MGNGKIGLDVRWIDQSGIGVTIRELLNNLDEEKKSRLLLFSEPGWVNSTGLEAVEAPFKRYGLAQHLRYGRFLAEKNLSLFHMPHFDIPYFCPSPFVATIHDLIHYLFPGFSTKPFTRLYSKALVNRIVQKGRKIITVSRNTKKDLMEHFNAPEEKIEVIYPGLNPAFRRVEPEKIEAVRKKHRLPEFYFLYVGNLRGSKNTSGLLAAYKILSERNPGFPPLVLAGKNFLEELFPRGVLHLGEVPFSDLPGLYAGASLFVFPSFYEGFGLPPLEAMACGTPVLASNAASLPEVCGDAAHYVDPGNLDSLVEGIESIWDSSGKRAELSRKGLENVKRFSWKKFADQTWQVYEEAGA